MVKVERIQYKVGIPVTGAWQSSSHTKLDEELG